MYRTAFRVIDVATDVATIPNWAASSCTSSGSIPCAAGPPARALGSLGMVAICAV